MVSKLHKCIKFVLEAGALNELETAYKFIVAISHQLLQREFTYEKINLIQVAQKLITVILLQHET